MFPHFLAPAVPQKVLDEIVRPYEERIAALEAALSEETTAHNITRLKLAKAQSAATATAASAEPESKEVWILRCARAFFID